MAACADYRNKRRARRSGRSVICYRNPNNHASHVARSRAVGRSLSLQPRRDDGNRFHRPGWRLLLYGATGGGAASAGGRDHWPHGFSLALAGGGIQGGRVIGETSPEPFEDQDRRGKDIVDPRPIEDVHATILHALGVDYFKQLETPVGRPMAITEGKAIMELLET